MPGSVRCPNGMFQGLIYDHDSRSDKCWNLPQSHGLTPPHQSRPPLGSIIHESMNPYTHEEMLVVWTCKFSNHKLSPACFTNFTIISLPRRSWSFIRPISLPRELASKFPSQVDALCAEPLPIRPSWLATVPISHFWEAAILSRLHWWVGGDHSYLPKLHTPLPCKLSIGICQSYRPTQASRPTTYLLLLYCKRAACRIFPTWREYSLGLMGFSMRHADTPPPTQRAINAR